MNNRCVIVAILVFIALTLLGVIIHPDTTESMETTSSTTIPPSVSSVPITIPPSGIITPGYYHIPNSGMMQPIPFGYKVSNPDISGNGALMMLSADATAALYTKSPDTLSKTDPITPVPYDADKISTVYHTNPSSVSDAGSMIPPVRYLTGDANKPFPIKFVPNYEESVYLSRTSGQTQVGTYTNESTNSKGFCAQSSNSFDDVNKNCNALGTSNCASTTCCVLLGNKCVAGNEYGPLSKADYIDPFLKNKDSYYYQGKCYGNCEKPAK